MYKIEVGDDSPKFYLGTIPPEKLSPSSLGTTSPGDDLSEC